ncbi:MAG: putative metal-dependent hydrolase [Gemmatimonadetes bacterium]|nr:putative metal-dependent hydrolase [Gemmatimonadota bacterium]
MTTPAATDPRFPVGKFAPPAAYDDAFRAAAIATLVALPANLRTALSGLTDAQLATPYRDGGWTVRQVVHHLADSHVNSYIRLRFALTTERPTIMPYPEEVWAELPDAKNGPIDTSLNILDGLHARWTMLLKSLKPAEFGRVWVHPDHGERTVDWMTALYSWHSRHHTAHVTELRRAKGW